MFRSRGKLNWYDPILLGLAALMVFPDYVLAWISDRTGRSFNVLHLVAVVVVGFALTALFMMLLMPYEPRLRWWQPALFVGVLAVFRLIYSFCNSLFDY